MEAREVGQPAPGLTPSYCGGVQARITLWESRQTVKVGPILKPSLSSGLCAEQLQKACWGQGTFGSCQGSSLHFLVI